MFEGFSTASGKNIKIEDKIVELTKIKYKDVFSDIEENDSFDCRNIVGFPTATRKHIKLENESVKLATSKNKDIFLKSEANESSDCSNIFKGFSTASGKNIKIEDKIVELTKIKYKDVFSDIEENDSFDCRNIVGFPTATRKHIKLENESVKLATSKNKDIFLKSEANESSDCSNIFKGFSTASGKNIKIEDKIVELTKSKYKDVFSDIEDNDSFDCRNIVGFPTATGKHIKLENESVKLATSKNKDIFLESEANESSDCSNIFKGFSTASGKNIKIEDKIVELTKSKYKDVFSDIEDNDSFDCRNIVEFATATGKHIKLENESVKLATGKYQDLYSGSEDNRDISKSDFNPAFVNADKTSYQETVQTVARHVMSPKENLSKIGTGKVFENDESDVSNKIKILSSDEHMTLEISESTDALMYDITNGDSTLNFSGAEMKNSTASNELIIDEGSVSKLRAKVISPVFDFNKSNNVKQKRKKRKRFIENFSANPLNVTYIRQASNSVNKSVKRKEAASNFIFPSSKKCEKFDIRDSAQSRERGAINQQLFVDNKTEDFCKPRKGFYLLRKLEGKRMSLREAVHNRKPRRFSNGELLKFGLKQLVIEVNSENAGNFVFTKDFFDVEFSHNTHGLTFGDECLVIPNKCDDVTFDELARAFLAAPGIDPKLISLPWIRNHYRWIVWKLASTEKSFPQFYGGNYLTLDNVLYQLKFKYDKEIDHCERSALKRILEHDDSASRIIVLCVAAIKQIENSLAEYEMELTDGWYSVNALIDSEMNKLISGRKVVVGTKLIVANAQLLGCTEGCDPLQADRTVCLKISTNAVRRVRWYTRLGFHSSKSTLCSNLKSILPNGGIIPQLSATIARIYSLLYLERKSDSFTAVYNEKIEVKKSTDYEKNRELCLERIASQVIREVEQKNLTRDCEKLLTNTKFSFDTDYNLNDVQEYKSREQDKLRMLVQDKIQERLPEEFKKQRNVVPILKIRLINDENNDSIFSALLTVWHPTEDLMSLMREGKTFRFHNIIANGLRNGELQLSTNRTTKYELLTTVLIKNEMWQRRIPDILELCSNKFVPLFGEIDAVGVLISVKDSVQLINNVYQTFYLADLNQNILAVKFRRGDIKDFGWEDVLKEKRIIACSDLIWKNGFILWRIPVTYVSEYTLFVRHSSRHKHMQSCLEKFHKYFKNQDFDTFVIECEKKLTNILNSVNSMDTSSPVTPIKKEKSVIENNLSSQASTTFFFDEIHADKIRARENDASTSSPLDCRNTSTPISKNLFSGIEKSVTENNLSSPASTLFFDEIHADKIRARENEASTSSPLDCRNTSTPVSKNLFSRIEKLRKYGQPPSLSPISLNTRPRRATKLSIQTRSFKSNNDKSV